MQALILAGGFGTRLYPLTKEIPKALIKINKKPIIEYIIQNLEKINEINEIYILSNNKFYINFLEWFNNFKNKTTKKIKILNNGEYSKEKGAINDFKYCLNIINNQDLLLLAADNFFEFNLQELINLSKNKDSSVVALKTLKSRKLIKKYSCVLLNNEEKIIFFQEKPQEPKTNICATACYFLKQTDIKKIKNHTFGKLNNLGEILDLLHKESKVYGRIYKDFWIDIGSFKELEKANKHLNKSKHL